MKVLFISRATLYDVPGGDTSQILNTAKFLRERGVDVDVRLCNETIDYRQYHLLHFFNVIRPADILHHIGGSGKPYVITPIFVDYSEFDRTVRKGISGMILRYLSPDALEYLKAVGRWVVNGEKLISPSFIWLGQRRSVQKILRHAACVLPNSQSELRRLQARYGFVPPARIVPNAIDPSLFTDGGQKEPDLVISVGRIEGLKNQLNLIRALNGTKYRLMLIGSPSPNHKGYFEECRKTAADNVSFINNIPQSELVGYYRRARVHVLPSWFETTGLSSLEAAASGCNLVITDKGDTRDYFGNDAWYCDPASPTSILEAVEKAASAILPNPLRKKILEQYTWSHTAQITLESYQSIIDNRD